MLTLYFPITYQWMFRHMLWSCSYQRWSGTKSWSISLPYACKKSKTQQTGLKLQEEGDCHSNEDWRGDSAIDARCHLNCTARPVCPKQLRDSQKNSCRGALGENMHKPTLSSFSPSCKQDDVRKTSPTARRHVLEKIKSCNFLTQTTFFL